MTAVNLPVARYRFHCRALTSVAFPRYAGSAWRGAFGHALRRTVCVTRLRDCRDCLLWRGCAYSYLFETPPPEGTVMLRKYPAAPHPFVIHPEATGGGRYDEGACFHVDLTLIDGANGQLPYIIHTWERMGQQGLGRARGRYVVETVSQWADGGWQTIFRAGGSLAARPPEALPLPPPPQGPCTLTLITPLRVKFQEKLMGAGDFSFRGLAAALLRRLSLLHYFHRGRLLEAAFGDLVRQAEAVTPVEADLHWYDWQRYSARQQTRMHMGGLLGKVVFTGESLTPFWPWLVMGQAVHVGKGAVMGLGGYRLTGAVAGLPPLPADGEQDFISSHA